MANALGDIARYTQELSSARQRGDRRREAAILSDLGSVYSIEKEVIDYSKAIEYYDQSNRIYFEIQHWYGFYRGCRAVGFIYAEIFRNHAKAIETYEYAIKNGGDVPADSEEGKIRRWLVDKVTKAHVNSCSQCGIMFDPNRAYNYDLYCSKCKKEFCATCGSQFRSCSNCEDRLCASCASLQLKHCDCESCTYEYCESCRTYIYDHSYATCKGCGAGYCEHCMDELQECNSSYCSNHFCNKCINSGFLITCRECDRIYCKEHLENHDCPYK